MRRAVKYCGGCHPGFDRVALVMTLEAKLGQPFEYAQSGEHYDELYVICGCTARCADVSGIDYQQVIVKDSFDEPEGNEKGETHV